MPQLKPLHDQFIIEEIETPLSDTKIVLSAKIHPTQQGKVIAVSDGYYRTEKSDTMIPLPVNVGDIVVFPRGCGINVDISNGAKVKPIFMLKVEHILGIIKPDENKE